MKYLVKYIPFLEAGAIPKIEGQEDEKFYISKRAKQEQKGLKAYLEHSPTMKDITCLIMEQARNNTIYDKGKPLHWRKRQEQNIIYSKDPFKYNVKVTRDSDDVSIHFDFKQSNRYFGQEAIITRVYDPVGYKLTIEENSKKTFEKSFDDIETCLRNCWAFFVSRFKMYTISTKYVPEVTRERLLADKSLWGHQYNAAQLLDLISIKDLGSEVNGEKIIDFNRVTEMLNGTFKLLGMNFELVDEEEDYEEGGETLKRTHNNRIKLPTRFGVKTNGKQNLLSLILEGITKRESDNGGTFEDMTYTAVETKRLIKPVTNFTDDVPKDGVYYIQPRNTKECFIQCLQKVYRLYYKHYDINHRSSVRGREDKIFYAGKEFIKPAIRKIIYIYTKYIANSILKDGLECLHDMDTFYKALYGCVSESDNDTLEIAAIIKNNAPEFWKEISKYDQENLDMSADLGDMGFGD